jgi:hypothetical protein
MFAISGAVMAPQVGQSMVKRRDWWMLPIIVIAGFLIGWASGQLVSLLPSQDAAVVKTPRPGPR